MLLDIAALHDGEITNYTNIGRSCGISVKTVQAYFQLLEDTFLLHRLPGWHQSARKQLVAHPKYYFFDMGVTNALCLQRDALNSVVRGRRFEQFIFLQMLALNAYHDYGFRFFHWRTSRGAEVDFLLVRQGKIIAAVEAKSSAALQAADTKHLLALQEEHPHVIALLVYTGQRSRQLADGKVTAVPWQTFLETELPKL